MAYQMARLPMTLSEAEGHFCCFKPLNLCNTHITQEIKHILTTLCLHINWKEPVACDLNFTVKGEGLSTVAGSHKHWKSGNISERVLYREVVTACLSQEVILVYGLCNCSNCNDLECP